MAKKTTAQKNAAKKAVDKRAKKKETTDATQERVREPEEGIDEEVGQGGNEEGGDVQDEAPSDEVQPADGGDVGEPEPEPDTGPVGVEPEQETTDGATEGDTEAGEAEAAADQEVAEEEVEGAVGAPPPIQIPDRGAVVLVTDDFGIEHEALIVRAIEESDHALIVCTKDGSDDSLVVLEGKGNMTWRAPG